MSSFRDRTAIVTGGGSGIGAALNQAVTATGPVRRQYQEFFAGERKKIDDWLAVVGVPAEERKPLAAAILSSLLGATLQWLVDPGDVDLEETVGAVADLIEDHLPSA